MEINQENPPSKKHTIIFGILLVVLLVIAGIIYGMKKEDRETKNTASKTAQNGEPQAEQPLQPGGDSPNREAMAPKSMVGQNVVDRGCKEGEYWCDPQQKCVKNWKSCDKTASLVKLMTAKYGVKDSEVKIEVDKESDHYVRGNLAVGPGGTLSNGIILATDINGYWDLVFDGNGGYSCEIVEAYEFPGDMIEDCERAESSQ